MPICSAPLNPTPDFIQSINFKAEPLDARHTANVGLLDANQNHIGDDAPPVHRRSSCVVPSTDAIISDMHAFARRLAIARNSAASVI